MSESSAVAIAAATGDLPNNQVHSEPVLQSVPTLACTVANAAQELDVAESTIWKLIRERKLKSIKIFNRRLIPRSELNRLVNEAA